MRETKIGWVIVCMLGILLPHKASSQILVPEEFQPANSPSLMQSSDGKLWVVGFIGETKGIYTYGVTCKIGNTWKRFGAFNVSLQNGANAIKFNDIEMFGDRVYLAGDFGIPGSGKNCLITYDLANNINGIWKSDFEFSAVSGHPHISSLAIAENTLFLAGFFAKIGALECNNMGKIKKGSSLSPVSFGKFSGANGPINFMESDSLQKHLYICGDYKNILGTNNNRFVKYRFIDSTFITTPYSNSNDVVFMRNLGTNLFFVSRDSSTREMKIHLLTENTFLKLAGLDSLFSLTNIFRSKGLYYFSGVARPEGDIKANGIFQLFPIKKAIRAYRKFSDIYFAESNNNTIYLSGNFPYQLTQNKYTFKLGRVDDSLQRFYGRIFYDRNNDGVFNNGDVRPGEKSIKVAPYNLLIPVDPSGFFSFIIPKGKSQLVKISLSKTAEIQAGFNYIFNADTFTERLINFPLKLNKNDFADIRVSISAAAGWQVRKDTSELYVLKVSNNGVVAATPDVNLNFNGKIVLIKPFPAPNVINPGKITWEKQALQPGEEKYYLIKLTTPSSDFAVNDEVKFEAGVANFVDDNPADNMDTLSQTVSAGVQGNAKLQFPEVQNGNSYADLDPYAGKIEYIIRFTNTTSDTIRTVVVRDTISTPDYVTYIQETGASHTFYRDVQTSPSLPNKVIVAYTFSNIKLPPNPTGNTELVNSSGYIGFRLGLAPALTSGTVLSNTAYIHLDNYAAIRTNTAMAQVQSNGIKAVHSNGNFTVFPNPFVDVLNFNATAENGNFRLTDLQGRTLLQTVISNNQIDLSNLELAQSAYIWSIVLPNGDTGSGIIVKK